MIRFFDLFAGAGGMRLGVLPLGWKPVGWCESDPDCVTSYRSNFDTRDEFYWKDARTLPVERAPDFNVLMAGFPCQSFSLAGHRRGFEDARGTLVYEVLRVLDAKNPRAFILENVKGLAYMEDEFSFIIKSLRGLGYRISWRILNSLDFGVPQRRERVYIVGIRGAGLLPSEFVWPRGIPRTATIADVLEPTVHRRFFLSKKMATALREHLLRNTAMGNGFGVSIVDETEVSTTIASRYWKGPGGQGGPALKVGESFAVNATNPHNPDETRKHHLSSVSRSAKAEWSVEQQPIVLQIKRYSADGDHMIREYDDAAPTLTEQAGNGGYNVPIAVEIVNANEGTKKMAVTSENAFTITCDPTTRHQALLERPDKRDPTGMILRRFTPRETFRLQGFPDGFKIVVSDRQAYRQAGNAVTVPVITAVARQLEAML